LSSRIQAPEVPFIAISYEIENYDKIVNYMFENKFTAKVAKHPVVRRGDQVIRLSFTAMHTAEDLEKFINMLDDIKDLL
jgi:7-keto-8-aminopelargonate synthetase-like enzyme